MIRYLNIFVENKFVGYIALLFFKENMLVYIFIYIYVIVIIKQITLTKQFIDVL